MKTLVSFSLSVLLFGVVSCSNGSEHEDPVPPVPPTTLNGFSVTKATSDFADSDFADGESIGLYIVRRTDASTPGVLAPTGNLFDNKHFVCTNGTMNASKIENYPLEVAWVDMYGYASFVRTGLDADNKLTFTVQSDQSDGFSTSDLLWATKTAVQTTAVAPELVFSHKLTKVIVKLTAGVGVTLVSPTVTINNTLPSVKLDMGLGGLSAAQGVATSIRARNIPSTTDFHAIIVPQQVNVANDFITITNGTKGYNYSLPVAKNFEGGKLYTYEIVVNTDDLSVKISGSVNDWGTGDTTTGEAQ